MRSGTWLVTGALMLVASARFCQAMDAPVADPVPLGPRALGLRIEGNPELASYIARRGYPDWAEEVEVDSAAPLDTHEVRLYYLRLDREIAFTRASILGRPHIGLRRYERPLAPAMRRWIEDAYLARDPARRAELAAERALAAAEGAERAADGVVDVAARAEGYASEMERAFHHELRK